MDRDGQVAFTANQSMGSHKLTNLANGTLGSDAVNFGQVFHSPSFDGAATLVNASIVGNLTVAGSVSMAGSVTVPTPPLGDDSTLAATTAFVNTVAMNANLPGQPGNQGRVVTTNGAAAFWAYLNTQSIPGPIPGAPQIAPTFTLSGAGEWRPPDVFTPTAALIPLL